MSSGVRPRALDAVLDASSAIAGVIFASASYPLSHRQVAAMADQRGIDVHHMPIFRNNACSEFQAV